MKGWINRLLLMKDQNNHFHWVYDTILKENVEMSSWQRQSIIAFPGSWGDACISA